MKTIRSYFRNAVLALCAAGLGSAGLMPAPVLAQEQPIVVAQADCYAIGQQIAAQNGGTLARATQAERGGQSVCVIVVLVPGKDGQRPRRQEFVVPN
jgi:hypothetical protein